MPKWKGARAQETAPYERGWTGRGVREETTLREDKLVLKRVEAAVS